jgi:hypothetical protein
MLLKAGESLAPRLSSVHSLHFLNGFRLGFELVRPLAKLLAYVVPGGQARQLFAPVGQRPKAVGVHRACLFAEKSIQTNICWSGPVRCVSYRVSQPRVFYPKVSTYAWPTPQEPRRPVQVKNRPRRGPGRMPPRHERPKNGSRLHRRREPNRSLASPDRKRRLGMTAEVRRLGTGVCTRAAETLLTAAPYNKGTLAERRARPPVCKHFP